ncbi:hypothetical protein [Planctomonas psychrotolerans]|uniref:hypothetical protein n=1 Tax=Planctomonas psychrotolerans TaxID=2528712 RepID=UPI00123BD228|nr:hypothetical protein [Planctomonas psychrotolerans]
MTNTASRRGVAAVAAVALVFTGLTGGVAVAAPAAPAEVPPLTNLAHLDFLLDQATPEGIEGHTTYDFAANPELTMPWTYADARDGGTFERVGGGPFDPVTGDWGQGAYNTDDISRAAVVYLRHWVSTGTESSRDTAYELLRALAYFQTTTGPDAGNVVLWMQPDGEFNRSPEPVELPDPSDSGNSYWLARTLWALGEGYAAFEAEDPEFADFLEDRLQLGVAALERESLARYGEYERSDGALVPAWLIVDGADASAEAVLGLAAYVSATAPAPSAPMTPEHDRARTALSQLSEGIAALSAGDSRSWPYGAVLPWAQSRSMWHAWASQMPAALAVAAATLEDDDLLEPAIADSATFVPTLLAAGGPDNGWFPTPADRVQIAYGIDSRLQSLLAVGAVTERSGFAELAGMLASWYFGTNRSGEAMYDPATGVTYDGVQPDGSINRNSGAESTIHGLLSMIALDANPAVRSVATSLTDVSDRDGLRVIEAEAVGTTTGTVVTPDSLWTGESLYSGDVLRLDRTQEATFDVGASDAARTVEPVSWLREERAGSVSIWRSGSATLGVLRHTVGEQGISAVSGALLPQSLRAFLPAGRSEVTVSVRRGSVDIDALLVRPLVASLTLSDGTADGVHAAMCTSAARTPTPSNIGWDGRASTVRVYDSMGRLVSETAASGVVSVRLPAGGFATAFTS